MERIIPTMCHGCFYGGYSCGILAHVKDGKFIKVEGNPYHPLNKGGLCAKGLSAVKWVYNPHRLKYPLMRSGNKGEGRFKRINWDKALDIVAEKIIEIKEKYGPEYIIFVKGQASGWFNLYHQLFVRFTHAIGSPNFSWWGPSVCFIPQLFYHICTVGGDRYSTADYENSDLIIEWFTSGGAGGAARRGSESANVNLRTVPYHILNRIEQGAKLVVINPQFIPLAANKRVYKWLPIRPGTDPALALAMINIIIKEGLYDKEFVSKWCYGFDRLKDHVQQYTPEWAEQITGIPKEDIIWLAHEYAKTEKACIRFTEAPQKADLISFARAIPILVAITGHLDKPGGNVFFYQSSSLHIDTFADRIPEEIANRAIGADRVFSKMMGGPAMVGADFVSVINAINTGKPYRPKAAIIVCSNPISTARNPKAVAEALKKLEFAVLIDVVPTPTSRYVDIILPAATKYEHKGDAAILLNHLSVCNKIIDPLYESRSELQAILDLAVRMGIGEDFWHGNYDSMLNEYISSTGISIDRLRGESLKGIYLPKTEFMEKRQRYDILFKNLPHKKVQLYNLILEKNGIEPLPTYKGETEDPINSPDLAQEYPLMFTDEHSDYPNHHSWMRSVIWLRKLRKYPYIKINPETADKYDIKDGDWIEVESPFGKMKAVAWLFEGIRKDTIMGQHGWWEGCRDLRLPEFPCLNEGVNVNILYNWEHREKITGDITKNTMVKIKKTMPPEEVSSIREE